MRGPIAAVPGGDRRRPGRPGRIPHDDRLRAGSMPCRGDHASVSAPDSHARRPAGDRSGLGRVEAGGDWQVRTGLARAGEPDRVGAIRSGAGPAGPAFGTGGPGSGSRLSPRGLRSKARSTGCGRWRPGSGCRPVRRWAAQRRWPRPDARRGRRAVSSRPSGSIATRRAAAPVPSHRGPLGPRRVAALGRAARRVSPAARRDLAGRARSAIGSPRSANCGGSTPWSSRPKRSSRSSTRPR